MASDNHKGNKGISQDNKPERKYKSLTSKNIFQQKIKYKIFMIKYNGRFYVCIKTRGKQNSLAAKTHYAWTDFKPQCNSNDPAGAIVTDGSWSSGLRIQLEIKLPSES